MTKVALYAKSEQGQLKFSNQREIQEYLHSVDGKSLLVTIQRATGTRTSDQNSALHLWFEMLAERLNEAGLTVQEVLSKKMELDWTPNRVKENLWRDAQIRLFGKQSTTQLDKVSDIDAIYDHLCRHLGEKFELEVPAFPFDPNKLK